MIGTRQQGSATSSKLAGSSIPRWPDSQRGDPNSNGRSALSGQTYSAYVDRTPHKTGFGQSVECRDSINVPARRHALGYMRLFNGICGGCFGKVCSTGSRSRIDWLK